MSTAVLSAPPVQPALFPPPSVPLHFTDGDRYEWPHTGDVWVRAGGDWVPTPDDGSGYLTDAEVRAQLHRAVVNWDVTHRFVPANPGGDLPGRLILALSPVHEAAQYVRDHQGDWLVPLRELVAQHDDDAAYDIPGVISGTALTDVLRTIVAEQPRVRMTYDEVAGRVYARYERAVELPGSRGFVECLHVFVFAASSAEVA
ncbi:hypothetical protein ACIQCG_00930 [Streptomyces noursei]|uniref:hypothetical protein n=1 Tax=Streptomyces noursei TaxID=1971 RepID=UPI00381C4979